MTRDPAEFGWHCWSDIAHPYLSSTTYVASHATSPTAPTTGLPYSNSRCQSKLRHNRLPLQSIPSTLTCLPHIHPPITEGSLYFIHPPKPRPPSSTSPINFRIHYLFQQSFIIHPLHMTICACVCVYRELCYNGLQI